MTNFEATNNQSTMVKSDIFWDIAAKVAEICQVNIADMVNDSREQSVVDARILTVQYAVRVGFSCSEIAEIILLNSEKVIDKDVLRKKARMVSNVYRAYMGRCQQNALFCILSKEVKSWVKETYGIGMDV